MVLQKGSFIQYSIIGKFIGMVTEEPMIFTKTIEKVNDDGTYVSNTAISVTFSENTVMTITEIDKDGTLSVNDGKNEYAETKDKFLSYISFTYIEKTEKNLKILDERPQLSIPNSENVRSQSNQWKLPMIRAVLAKASTTAVMMGYCTSPKPTWI